MKTNIQNLIERQKPGYSLEQPFYNDEEFFKLDMQRVLFKQWLFVDHESRIPNPGDFITYEIANESIIIVRGKNDEIHAHFNVCTHRGSRICSKSSGSSAKLVCPYHAWVFNLDGSLKIAKQMPEDFDANEHGLKPCRIGILEGLMFINIDPEDSSDFNELADNVRSFFKPHSIPTAKIAHTEHYTVNANWKLVIENFRECYHCSPSHPEYTSVNEYVQVGDRELGGYMPTVNAWIETQQGSGREAGFKNFPYHLQPHHAWRMPIRDGYQTATQDGTPVAPLMGDFAEYDNAETAVFFSPLTYFYLNNDYASGFRVTPISTNETRVTITWFVHGDAQEGVDYDVEKLKWLWDVTTKQDAHIVNENQIGVNSSRYEPGPYSKREYGTADFTAWYIARMQGKQDERIIFRS